MSSSPTLTAMLLLGGILPLAAGPLLATWAERSKATKSALDAFIAVSLAGIVVLHLWPHAFLVAGGWALVGGLAGLLLPFFLHGALHSQEDRIYPAMLVIAFFGLALHAILDGVALLSPLMSEQADAHPDHHHGEGHPQGSAYLLAIAVILHRLPMGIAVWWLTVPVLGRRVAIGVLGTIAVATILGFGIAGRILVDLSIPAIAIFEATIAGMLLHVVMGHEHKHESLDEGHEHGHHEHGHHGHGHHGHGHHGHGAREEAPRASALGALAGLALIAGLFQVHPMEHRLTQDLSFNQAFSTLAVHLAPWLLLGVGLEILRGALFSREHSFEEPLRSELALPAGAVTLGLLGWQSTLLYLVGFLWTLGCLRGSRPRPGKPPKAAPEPLSGKGWLARFERLAHRGGVWSLAGIAVVALMEPTLRIDPWTALDGPDWLSAAFGGVVAIVLGALCGRSSLFAVVLAFVFAHMGWSGSNVFLFLFAALTARVLRSRPAHAVKLRGPNVALLMAGLGLLAAAPQLGLGATTVDFHDLAIAGPTPWQLAALALLALSLSASLFLRGFRGFLHPVFDRAPELHGVRHAEETAPHGGEEIPRAGTL